MPLYLYRCPTCDAKREILKKIADIDRAETCTCGSAMNRSVTAPMVRGDYPPYQCPITGNWIEGRRAHEENLQKHGCRVLEEGETERAMQAAKERDEALFEQIGETAARLTASLPPEKQERLAAELDSGLDLSVQRSTPTF